MDPRAFARVSKQACVAKRVSRIGARPPSGISATNGTLFSFRMLLGSANVVIGNLWTTDRIKVKLPGRRGGVFFGHFFWLFLINLVLMFLTCTVYNHQTCSYWKRHDVVPHHARTGSKLRPASKLREASCTTEGPYTLLSRGTSPRNPVVSQRWDAREWTRVRCLDTDTKYNQILRLSRPVEPKNKVPKRGA